MFPSIWLPKKVNALFAVPNTEDQGEKQMWQLLKPLKVDVFEKYWQRVEGEQFDYSQCELVGDRMYKQDQWHGFGRDGRIYESVKNNSWHGLWVFINSNNINIEIYKNGSRIFDLDIDKSGNETKRNDKHNQFADITREAFFKN